MVCVSAICILGLQLVCIVVHYEHRVDRNLVLLDGLVGGENRMALLHTICGKFNPHPPQLLNFSGTAVIVNALEALKITVLSRIYDMKHF